MPSVWNDFFVAVAGAAAALAGLVFVAISINLSRILQFPDLPSRAFEALAVLVGILLVALFGLVPGQSVRAFAIELVVIGVASWGMHSYALMRHRSSKHARNPMRVLMNQLPSLPLIVAGVLLWQRDAVGVYWIVPGVVLSFVAGVLGAWVMLVEIQR
ncbi:MAG: hypothetical protein QM756_36140 [Polyangiaceae bacterium]